MVPGSMPGDVTGFFSDMSSSDRNMALGSTQPLVKISTRDISWRYRRPVREGDDLTTLKCLNLPEPSGPHRACYGTPLTSLSAVGLHTLGMSSVLPRW